MRVTGGRLGGRRLRAPSGLTTRPSADRVRQALFNILPAPPPGWRVLDLYAGSGALGIEALSRGADHATFVEQDAHAAAVLRRNLHELGLTGQARLIVAPVERALSRLGGPFGWVFADPPYLGGLLGPLLERLGAPGNGLLRDDSVVVVEHPGHSGAPVLHEMCGVLCLRDRRCYGQTALSFYVPVPARPAPDNEDP
ncbi:MAG: 16S rRNA (guanine(966)-N(2))-methyltransferase RsmD [Myxococcales bacterium]|nr:16S rRNA (guanine(966)-N(2))-methyltransferase RsmD [Myxococcota bacterium]MDW8281563.1 16S rRNA (guanine(966)-N(2))-methyltransferase RsmD [Myxococcales bacterium]